MIPAQTFRVCREGNRYTFPDHAAGNKKAPDLFRRGFGSGDAIVRLRAHASRGPRGLCGFAGAFGGRDHERELMGETAIDVNGFWTRKIGLNEVELDRVVTR
jgi:hypothetical protein